MTMTRKVAIAKLMPRTLWDEGIENLLFQINTMEPATRASLTSTGQFKILKHCIINARTNKPCSL